MPLNLYSSVKSVTVVQDSPHFVFQLTVSSSESEEPKDPENENDIDDRGKDQRLWALLL